MQNEQTSVIEIDPRDFRRTLGSYPTGVCVVTGCDKTGRPSGLAIGSFTSVSLSPPLVAFFPSRTSSSWENISKGGAFCVNVLAHDQLEICKRFAQKSNDKLKGVAHQISDFGLPILDDVIAYIECKIHDQIITGDHLMVLGRVLSLNLNRDSSPLIFFKGEYRKIASYSPGIGNI
ncbi:flavin reductase family protein [Parasphingorhabdus sp.]|uniref:flavin reductase family protein n=1 Tax=Parasphingorhabdus sp. TaxID=2709688 RepID=UPI003A941BEB